MISTRPWTFLVLLALGFEARSAHADELAEWIKANYTKREVSIPARDGVKLFTAIYEPVDRNRTHPFLMCRTPYSVSPYGAAEFKSSLGPSESCARAGYIFVYQDVRGRNLSEGDFVDMTPHVDAVERAEGIDESSDTFDTIAWLLENVPNHNGRCGMWGISYPGFYCSAGMIDAHPALKAVSPQAPIADWFFDDFHHHGAFFLPHAFNFFADFGRPRSGPSTERGPRFEHGTEDGYRFFLELGSLKNANERYLKGEIAFWNELAAHPNYDDFWRARNLLPHLTKVAPAVLVVGGWFDAEDLYGALQTYRTIERQNPGIVNALVMGPWRHGGWGRSTGESLGIARFGAKTSEHYRTQIEFPFFEHYLKGDGSAPPPLPEATVFETGTNQWQSFDQWPPPGLSEQRLYCRDGGRLLPEAPAADDSGRADTFVSDPAKPVPFTEADAIGMTGEYMTDDQRFAARRPDVLAYSSDRLNEDLTVAGPIHVELWVTTSGQDADWVVKLIDVFPGDAESPADLPDGERWSDCQMMVRSEVFRGRFRNSYERPEPFRPNEPARVAFDLQDVLHTFKAGHRIMIQVQSTWFPLVDRNPQKWVDNIFEAEDTDFVPAQHAVLRSPEHATSITFGVLPKGDK